MSPTLRIDDKSIIKNFHAISKRCLITCSIDNQFTLLLLNQLYSFKCTKNHLQVAGHLTSDVRSRSKISNPREGYNNIDGNYYIDLQKQMCTNAIMDNPRFVWTSWTPKCIIKDNKVISVICTITLDNCIGLWIPNDSSNDIYNMENLLDIRKVIENDIYDGNIYIRSNYDDEYCKKRLLFCLNNISFSSCDFVELDIDMGFLCILSIDQYIVVVWISNSPIRSHIKNIKSVGRRRTRNTKFNLYDEGGDEDEEEEHTSKNNKHYINETSLDLYDYLILNRQSVNINDFDINKCKDYFPMKSSRNYINLLYGKTICIINVGPCTGILSLRDEDGDYSCRIYYSQMTSIECININLKFKDSTTIQEVEVKLDSNDNIPKLNVEDLQGLNTDSIERIGNNSAPELLKHYIIFDYKILTLVQDSIYYLYINGNVLKFIKFGNVPLITSSLEPLFNVNGNLFKITATNSNGIVYNAVVDANFNIEMDNVNDKSTCNAIFTCNNDVLSFECLVIKNILELRVNLYIKSIFFNILNLLINHGDISLLNDFIINNKDMVPTNSIFHTINRNSNDDIKFNNINDTLILLNYDDVFKLFHHAITGEYEQHDKLTITLIYYLIAIIDLNTDFIFNNHLIIFNDDNVMNECCRIISKIQLNIQQMQELITFVQSLYKHDIIKLLDNL